jgi:hypothetical protein
MSSCDEPEKVYPDPSIQFVTDEGYVYSDTTLLLSDTILIGIIADTKSEDELTHFNTTILKDTETVSIDTGIFTSHFRYDQNIVKGIAENETWLFYIRDRYGRKSNVISIVVALDSASIFGEIKDIPSIVFGAQDNTNYGGYYSLVLFQLFNQSDAYDNQSAIDLLYYYDNVETDENTIASPGASIDNTILSGDTGVSNWADRNTLRFIYKENVTIEEFDNCENDSLILENTFVFASGKRKAKNLTANQIYSFVSENGKRGMFKVVEVQGQEEGSIEVSLKMQSL